MHGNHYRTWAPPASPLRIEYTANLIRELRVAPDAPDRSGILYGHRLERGVRVVSTQSTNAAAITPVGIFSARSRGEVFLTESDLHRLETSTIPGGVALVIAGSRAGFFLHEPDGSMQTVQSHLEFSISPGETPAAPRNPPARALLALGGLVLAAVPVLARISKPTVTLNVRHEAGQLRISWDRTAAAPGARLEIQDGPQRLSIPISANLTSATYVAQTTTAQATLVTRKPR